MNTTIGIFCLILWVVGSPIAAFNSKKASSVFIISTALALPGLIFSIFHYGMLDSGGIGQLLGAGLYGLLFFWGLKLIKWLRQKKQ